MNKKVYLCITPFFPTAQSFRGPYVYDQVRAIEAADEYRVVVLHPALWDDKAVSYTYGGVTVNLFAIYDLPTNMWPGANTWLSVRAFDRCLQRLGIAFDDIAVVHAHTIGMARFANHVKEHNPRCLTMLQHHGYDMLGFNLGRFRDIGWHKRLVLHNGVKQCNKIDLHIGVSRQTLTYLEAHKGIKLKDTYVLYNGVDMDKFRDERQRKDGEPYHIGCVANFWELKDQMTLIRAVETLVGEGVDDVRVSFVGTGATRERCERYVAEKGLGRYVEFRTEVDHTQLCAYYNTLDLFVLPSYWDAFGCVYTEAYACGVPFMTASGSGITELIPADDFHRWVIEPHDYTSLARNIKEVMAKRGVPASLLQPLTSPIDITTLVGEFLRHIAKETATAQE